MTVPPKKKKTENRRKRDGVLGAARAGGRRRGRGPAGSVSAPRGADRPLRPRPLCRRPVTPAPPLSSMQTRVRMAHTGMESARAALGHQETYFLKSGGMDVVAPHLHYMLCAARVNPPQPSHGTPSAGGPPGRTMGDRAGHDIFVPGRRSSTRRCSHSTAGRDFSPHRLSGAVRRGGVGRFLVHCRHLFGDRLPTNTAGQVRMPGAPAYIHT